MTVVCCDVGNSRCKIALSTNGVLSQILAISIQDLNQAYLKSLIAHYPVPDQVFVSSVVPTLNDFVLEAFSNLWNCKVTFIKPDPLPFSNQYKAGAQTGIDRLANVAGGLKHFSPPFIIADIGSAVNTEIVDSTGAFIGGNIFPGINLQLASLFQKTANLPYISPLSFTQYWGANTDEAIFSGICLNISGALQKLIGYFEKEWECEQIQLILTGGDSSIISPLLDIPHFTDLNLTLNGIEKLGFYQQ